MKTVTILPQTNDTTLCLRMDGTITLIDYMENFDAPVKKIAGQNGWYNLYVEHTENFRGWNEDAACASFKCISEYGPRARRLAYVNPPDSRRLLMRMMQPIMNAELRFFELGEEADAMAWMMAYKAN